MRNAFFSVFTLFFMSLLGCAHNSVVSDPGVEPYQNYIYYNTQADPIQLDGNTFFFEANCRELSEPQYVEKLSSELKNKLQKLGLVESKKIETSFLTVGLACTDSTDYYRSHSEKSINAHRVEGKLIPSKFEVRSDAKSIQIESSFNDQITEKIQTRAITDRIISARLYVFNQRNKKYRAKVADQTAVFVPSADFLKQSWSYLTADFLETVDKIEISPNPSKKLCMPRFGFEFADDRAHIKEVPAKTPAAKAGLRKGDKVVEIHGVSPEEFYEVWAKETFESQKTVPIEILRNGKTLIKAIAADQICHSL